MTQHRSTHLLVALLATLGLALGLLAGPASAASSGGPIKGVVTLDGKPLAGVKVALMRTDTDSGDAFTTYKTATTSSTGAYSFAAGRPLTGWNYSRVIVTDPQGRAVSTVRTLNGRSTGTVTRNVTMKRAGSITGKVTRADGSAATATRVSIEGPSVTLGDAGNERLAYDDDNGVRADGTYRFVGLPAGSYTIRYDDTAKNYLSECYDDLLARQAVDPYCGDDATEITVQSGADTTPAAQELNHPGAHLRGTVTDTSGNPLKDISVTPIRVGAATVQTPWDEYFSTRSSGRFTRSPIDPGDWQIRVSDTRGIWAARWYDSESRTDAEVFTLVEGSKVGGLDIKLKSRAKLSVKATPGTRRATFAIDVTRRATGSRPSGRVTVSLGAVSRTVAVTKGVATVTLTGLPTGKQTFEVDYQGTVSTADERKTVTTTIR